MNSGIWAVAECAGNELHEVSFEALGHGRMLKASLGSELVAILPGCGNGQLAESLIQHGADKVYVVDHPLLADYSTEIYTHALSELVTSYSPDVVLVGATPNGCDFIPRVATRLNAELVTNCTSLKARAGSIEAMRPEYGGKVYRQVVCSSPPPLLFSIKPGVLGKDKPDSSRKGETVVVQPELGSTSTRATYLGVTRAESSTLELDEAEVVVVGGAGLGDAESWRMIEELADLLGGCTGGTRLALDAGWIDRDRLVGQTGKRIAPRLCLEVGVSGAIQHAMGVRDAKVTIAINKDRKAFIFEVADVGVLADLHELLPALAPAIRELKAGTKV